jgi:hypothetical protein
MAPLPDRARGHRQPLHPGQQGKYRAVRGGVRPVGDHRPWLRGFLTERISWRWIFVNIPLGLVWLRVIGESADGAPAGDPRHRLPRVAVFAARSCR